MIGIALVNFQPQCIFMHVYIISNLFSSLMINKCRWLQLNGMTNLRTNCRPPIGMIYIKSVVMQPIQHRIGMVGTIAIPIWVIEALSLRRRRRRRRRHVWRSDIAVAVCSIRGSWCIKVTLRRRRRWWWVMRFCRVIVRGWKMRRWRWCWCLLKLQEMWCWSLKTVRGQTKIICPDGDLKAQSLVVYIIYTYSKFMYSIISPYLSYAFRLYLLFIV